MKRLSPLLLAALFIACTAPGEGTDSKAPGAAEAAAPDAGAERRVRVKTETVSTEMFEDRVEITGALEAVNDATLSAQSAGTVKRLAKLGTKVDKGALLASLDAELLSASVKQARAQLEVAKSAAALAQDGYDRQKPLHEEGVISALEFESINARRNQAIAQVTQAEAAVAQASKQLTNARVSAPFAGIVEERFVEEGEQVNPGQPILRITDTHTMRVKAGMPERYAADIKTGAAIQIRFNAYGLGVREGRLTFVGRTINKANRTFVVEAELANPDGVFKPEMVARLLVTRSRLSDAITLPLSAVVRDETGEAVFVVDRSDGAPRATRRPVVTGVGSKERVVVTEGLKDGEEVVIAGQSNLTRGDLLEIEAAKADARAQKQ